LESTFKRRSFYFILLFNNCRKRDFEHRRQVNFDCDIVKYCIIRYWINVTFKLSTFQVYMTVC
jgi:hypothetical protein